MQCRRLRGIWAFDALLSFLELKASSKYREIHMKTATTSMGCKVFLLFLLLETLPLGVRAARVCSSFLISIL
jgi:hypothetical protein